MCVYVVGVFVAGVGRAGGRGVSDCRVSGRGGGRVRQMCVCGLIMQPFWKLALDVGHDWDELNLLQTRSSSVHVGTRY